MRISKSSSKHIAHSFGRSVKNYHQKADIQRKVADGLVSSIRPWKDIIPQGPILEIGCGTGILTEKIISEFPARDVVITDISDHMLSFTKERIGTKSNLEYQILDVDQLIESDPKFSCIVSNFAVQWFSDPALGLEKLGKLLLPGGLLLVTFPGSNSFIEWYEKCLELGLPYTANSLPEVEEMIVKLSLGPFQIDYYEHDLHQKFRKSLDFFRHLKEIGAAYSLTGKSLNSKQVKLLTNYWDSTISPISVKWHVLYLAAKKDMI